jgi:hypothetical protein
VRSVVAIFGVYVLALLLAGSFPVGAGDARHGGALLHPAYPHIHEPSAAQQSGRAPSLESVKIGLLPAIDASAGGATEIPSTALTPPLPRAMAGLFPLSAQHQILIERRAPESRLEPPPDPPPSTSAVVA